MFGFKKTGEVGEPGRPHGGEAEEFPPPPGNLHLREPHPAFTPKMRPSESGGAEAHPTPFRPEIPRRILGEIPGLPKPFGAPPAPPQPKVVDNEAKMLIVGRDITLNGQISACEKLVVEGRVEAALTNCRTIEVAESGAFKGSAEIEDADVRGRVEGKLTVRGRLLIRSTGKVIGEVRYGQIEIECGGEISGNVQSLLGQAKAAAVEKAALDQGLAT